MYVFVYDAQVAGYSVDEPIGLPNGFRVFPVDSGLNLDDLFFDGVNVVPKPPKPSNTAYWSGYGWAEPYTPPPPKPFKFTDRENFGVIQELGRTKVNPLVAEVITYILARLDNNVELINSTEQSLVNLIADYRRQAEEQQAIAT